MSEKPQAARAHEQEDLIQLTTQGLEKLTAPGHRGGAETKPTADKKNRRSAVYFYLLILFGAAFLMLLLAYFVQQRSSENTTSDLRDSTALSRENPPEGDTAFHFDFQYSQTIDVSRETSSAQAP